MEFEKTKRPSFLCFGYFSLAKHFNHIAKTISILHLKSNGNCKSSYFPTSTPSGHISHLHNWLITSDYFWYGKIRLTYYKWLIFDMDMFWHLIWANLTSHKLSLFFFFLFSYPFVHIFLIYSVSINKVLEGWIKQNSSSLLSKQR